MNLDELKKTIEDIVSKVNIKQIDTLFKNTRGVIATGQIIRVHYGLKQADVRTTGNDVYRNVPYPYQYNENTIGEDQTCVIINPDPRNPNTRYIVSVYGSFSEE